MTAQADLIAQLVTRLRGAGIATDAESLADALWLSERMGASDDIGQNPSDGHFPVNFDSAPPADLPAPPGTPDPRPSPAGRPAGAEPVPLHAVRDVDPIGMEEALQIRIPVASAFPGLLPLERALRPLQRYRPRTRPVRGELDEVATAETSARSGHIIPVFHEVRRREAQLLLVMDDSPSMVVWDQMLEELRLVCQQVGAFRDVAVHYLRPRPDGEAGITAVPGGGEPLAPADRLRDPTGRTVMLLLSDCSGALWRRGAAQRLLHRFARTGPVAVLQPLPQRMWQRTLLPAEPGLLRGAEGRPGRLEFVPRRRRGQTREPGALAVPVLSPTQGALGAWARAVSGTTPSSLDAAAAWVHAEHTGAEPQTFQERNPEQLVQDFQAVSSPAAQHLSVYLSAAPLAYPVMQLVQRAMMPQTGPIEMAEVLLSGLLLRQDDPAPPTVPAQREHDVTESLAIRRVGPWYEFAPGVQDVLLRRLGLGEASLVLKHCSLYVERMFGRRARNFPAMVVGYLSGSGPFVSGGTGRGAESGTTVPTPFAEVAQKVLRRFQPGGVGPADFDDTAERGAAAPQTGVVIAHRGRVVDNARERLIRFQDQGTIRDLWEAIRLLRTAPADERQPLRTVPLHSLLAECLLALWEARQGDEVLAEAESTARAATELADRGAVPGTLAGRAHLVHGRVLMALAGQEEPRSAAGQTLTEAAVCLTRAEALLRGAPAELVTARMCLVEVAKERYAITGDRYLLHDAQGRLDAVLEAWPADDPVPWRVLSARGGLLYALADDALRREAPDEARSFALRAVADFSSVAAVTGDPEQPSADRAKVLLDLAAARATAAGDPGATEVLAELGRALEAAGTDPDLRLRCLRRLGQAHRARYALTADPAELSEADRAFAQAQRLVPTDEPARAELLVERGAVLVDWAEQGGGPGAATNAVRVLREALSQTPESDPRLAWRRLLFGRALRGRHAAGGALTDLHEAEWILARAARGARDSRTAAEAWLERGDVLTRLAHGAGARERLDDAATSYRLAAEGATQAHEWMLAARAHHQRAAVLEETAGRESALAAYRRAWGLWQRAGAAQAPQARSTRERMRQLEENA